MTRKFSGLRKNMSAAARAESDKEHQRLVQAMPLRQLRTAHALTQEQLARVLKVNQSEISKIEQRTDMYLSTLAGYIKAMGGTLELRAVFPRGDTVKISQFEELTKAPGRSTNRKRS